MIDVQKILNLQSTSITNWHLELQSVETDLPWKYIEENNQWNFLLWHEEDITRIPDIEPIRMVTAKCNIDEYNQERNNAMEQIDEWVLNYLLINKTASSEKLHSETPGMMIDRLSIMQLKIYHMAEESNRIDASDEHKIKCSERVVILKQQINDLADCLDGVFNALKKGNIKFKVYRQFKMYNDVSLNPQLYKSLS